ncbi:actin filament-associated protein 1-like 2 isoform X2 [Betta splendens]|uniref:Actin filament-associated protein 1-like 2 isoform X2 n=1 Tax=Betta splendens TaxID=158456 RepID=A0A6P7NBK9_BETSP|nr:actin filament-associated protein 1-like 2 isoform X2 [Betta splendens]
MDKQKALAKLIWDLRSFLLVLDSENLSYIAQAQKKSISDLLSKLQSNETPVEDAEYMVMSCPSSSPSNELPDTPATDASQSSKLDSKARDWIDSPSVPPHPPGGLGNDDDEDTYEEAEPYVAAGTGAGTGAGADRDSDSSHYESYGEDEEPLQDRAHYVRWSASQPCLRPVPEARLCGYLWRRRWLGQWTKQLFIVRQDALLCYKCAQDLLPQLELSLRGCRLSYKSKSNRRIQHQLKLVPLGSETLVLGYNSFQQAEEWRKVMEEAAAEGEPAVPPSCRSRAVQTEEEKALFDCSLHQDKAGLLNVLMNCQWQSLACRVEAGVLNMFAEGEEEEEEQRQQSPQYTVQLRGCEVRAGPDTERSHRITLSMLGDQVAVLEVRPATAPSTARVPASGVTRALVLQVGSSEEKERWVKLLHEGAAHHRHHDNRPQEDAGAGVLSGLQTWRFPTDDAFRGGGAIYSNTAALQHALHSSEDTARYSVSSREFVTYSNSVFTSYNKRPVEVERAVQKLELTRKEPVPRRAGSEINLASAGKQNKRTLFRQSLAVCTERAQTGFLNPLLRRTASAKTSLGRAPSAPFIQHGKVFQRRKEWETKAAA